MSSIDELGKLRFRHSILSKRVAKMEREREKTRNVDHKTILTELKKEKLRVKDQINKLSYTDYDWDIHQGGVESFK